MRAQLEKSSWHRILYFAGATSWIVCVALGMSVLAKHEVTPGVISKATGQWPRESSLRRSVDGPTMVMFAHPRCPCTRASLAELASIVSSHRDGLSGTVVFFQPADADSNWMNTDQVKMASSIPGVKVVNDIGGSEARCFDAITSGQTFLYDKSGNLVFSGGITMSRGHIGDNAGRHAIETILAGHTSAQTNAPVFGCSIRECK